MIFSHNLKKFRLQKNLTQEQVAEILGVSSHTISRWECSTTLPDVTLLPELARLYCVTVDDFFKETSVPYDNYAQRLASVYESTREPADFIRADQEFKKILKTGNYTAEDLRLYGVLHYFMMQYSMNQAVTLFDRALKTAPASNEDTIRRTKHQKLLLFSQIGRCQEIIDETLKRVTGTSADADDWCDLILAYHYAKENHEAYQWFLKAIEKFPLNAILYVCGGDICKELCRYEEAFTYWDKSLELDATVLDAKYSKAICLEEQGKYEEAYVIWCEIIEDLKKDGYDVEAAAEEKQAMECLKKLNK